MNDQGTTIYGRIAEAVGYIQQNSGEQTTPEHDAGKVQLSPTNFEKL